MELGKDTWYGDHILDWDWVVCTNVVSFFGQYIDGQAVIEIGEELNVEWWLHKMYRFLKVCFSNYSQRDFPPISHTKHGMCSTDISHQQIKLLLSHHNTPMPF